MYESEDCPCRGSAGSEPGPTGAVVLRGGLSKSVMTLRLGMASQVDDDEAGEGGKPVR